MTVQAPPRTRSREPVRFRQVLARGAHRDQKPGVEDVCLVVCDGLKGLPESITTTWSFAQVQTCILHLIRNTFRYASRADWDELARDLRPVYTAVNAEMAGVR
jgi:transposase-like protein